MGYQPVFLLFFFREDFSGGVMALGGGCTDCFIMSLRMFFADDFFSSLRVDFFAFAMNCKAKISL
jgi:hypothetical protein